MHIGDGLEIGFSVAEGHFLVPAVEIIFALDLKDLKENVVDA